jgi:DNA-binding Lrp family transcriptional regulator
LPIAFILINAELGKEDMVLAVVRALPEVKEAYMVYGVYDIIIKVEAETTQAVKDVVFSKIRRIDNVRSTVTMMVLRE